MPQGDFGGALLFGLWGVGKSSLFMDELGYVVEALLILNLAKGNLDDVVAHACAVSYTHLTLPTTLSV